MANQKELVVSEILTKIKDHIAGNLTLGGLRDHFADFNFQQVSIDDLIQKISSEKSFKEYIQSQYFGDRRDHQCIFLMANQGQWEVFDSERGSKHGVELFEKKEDALFDFLDRILNEIGYPAPDSVINN